MSAARNEEIYEKQGFGQSLPLGPPAAVVIVDFVNGFANPEVMGGGNIQPAIDKTVELLDLARERGWEVVFTRVVYADDGSDANVFCEKVPGNLAFTEASHESQVVSALAPRENELIVRKHFPSAFFGTTLAPWLAMRGVKTLIVAGCTTSGCVRASVLDAMCHGFRPIVATDCCGDRSIAQHESNLFDMKMKYAETMELHEITALTSLQQANT